MKNWTEHRKPQTALQIIEDADGKVRTALANFKNQQAAFKAKEQRASGYGYGSEEDLSDVDDETLLKSFKEVTGKEFPKKEPVFFQREYLQLLHHKNQKLSNLRSHESTKYCDLTLDIGCLLSKLGFAEEAEDFFTKSMCARIDKFQESEQKQQVPSADSNQKKWQFAKPIKIGVEGVEVLPQSASHVVKVQNLQEKLEEYQRRQAISYSR